MWQEDIDKSKLTNIESNMKQKSGGNRELTTFCGLYYMAKVLAGNDVVGDHQTQDGGPRCNGVFG